MRRPAKLIAQVFSILIVFGMFLGCENMPVMPENTGVPGTGIMKPVPVNPELIGLAKSSDTHSRYIPASIGGTLGGPQTGGNFVVIPPNTLQESMYLEFQLIVIDDEPEQLAGALAFNIEEIEQPRRGIRRKYHHSVSYNSNDHSYSYRYGSDDDEDEFLEEYESEDEEGSRQIYFREGKTARLYVSKDWLEEEPTCVVNVETGIKVGDVVDTGAHWMVEVSHFSGWAWMWDF